jgi:hypothetical protein
MFPQATFPHFAAYRACHQGLLSEIGSKTRDGITLAAEEKLTFSRKPRSDVRISRDGRYVRGHLWRHVIKRAVNRKSRICNGNATEMQERWRNPLRVPFPASEYKCGKTASSALSRNALSRNARENERPNVCRRHYPLNGSIVLVLEC